MRRCSLSGNMSLQIVSPLSVKEVMRRLDQMTTAFPSKSLSLRWDSSAPLIGRVKEERLFLGKNGFTFGCGPVFRGAISDHPGGSIIRGRFIRWNPVLKVLSGIWVLGLGLGALQMFVNGGTIWEWVGIFGLLCALKGLHCLFRQMGKGHKKFISERLHEVADSPLGVDNVEVVHPSPEE